MNTDLFGEFTVLHKGESVGTLSVGAAGLMTEFICECVYPTAQVLRLAVLAGNDRAVLGVMMPEEDKLRFRKKYSKNDLSAMKIQSIEGALLITSEEASSPYDAAKHPVPKPLLKLEPEKIEQERIEHEPIQPEPSVPEPTEREPAEPEPTRPESPESEPAEPEPPAAPIEPEPSESGQSGAADNELSSARKPEPEPAGTAPSGSEYTEPVRQEQQEFRAEPVRIITYEAEHPPVEVESAPAEPLPRCKAEEHCQGSGEPEARWREESGDTWQAEPETQLHFADKELQMLCRTVEGALKKKGVDGETLLAIPFDTDRPFPLMSIFCFGEAIRIQGKNYLVFRVRDGAITG